MGESLFFNQNSNSVTDLQKSRDLTEEVNEGVTQGLTATLAFALSRFLQEQEPADTQASRRHYTNQVSCFHQ